MDLNKLTVKEIDKKLDNLLARSGDIGEDVIQESGAVGGTLDKAEKIGVIKEISRRLKISKSLKIRNLKDEYALAAKYGIRPFKGAKGDER